LNLKGIGFPGSKYIILLSEDPEVKDLIARGAGSKVLCDPLWNLCDLSVSS